MIGTLFKRHLSPANRPARPKPRDVTAPPEMHRMPAAACAQRGRARKSELVTLFASRLSTSVVANDRP